MNSFWCHERLKFTPDQAILLEHCPNDRKCSTHQRFTLIFTANGFKPLAWIESVRCFGWFWEKGFILLFAEKFAFTNGLTNPLLMNALHTNDSRLFSNDSKSRFLFWRLWIATQPKYERTSILYVRGWLVPSLPPFLASCWMDKIGKIAVGLSTSERFKCD